MELGARLRKKGWTLAVAESCSGGLVGDKITNVSGSSDYFLGGLIAYSNEIKRRCLKVPAAMLRRHGAVSRETAVAMAKGARRLFGSRVAMATTGIAGPTGGTKEKPVGLVYFAVTDGKRTQWQKKFFSGNRLAVKKKTALCALQMLKKFVG